MAGSLSPHPLSISSFLNPKPQCQVTNRPIFGTFLPSMRNRNFFFPLPPRLSRVTDNPNPFRACRAVTTWHKPARSSPPTRACSHFGRVHETGQDSRKKEREVSRTSLKGSGERDRSGREIEIELDPAATNSAGAASDIDCISSPNPG